MERKIIDAGPAIVKSFIRGINKVDQMVGGTLGPSGKNRIIQRKYRSPLVTNDGVTIARNMVLDDEIEDLAAQVLVEIAMKTNEAAGDGTTTSIVIASELARSCFEKMGDESKSGPFALSGENMASIDKKIHSECVKALEVLESIRTNPIEHSMLEEVISTSLENHEYGEKLSEIMQEVGTRGYISVEDNWLTKSSIDTELTKGMRFLGTYASAYLASDRNKKEAVMEEAAILVTNERIVSASVLKGILDELKKNKIMRLVIIGGYSENVSPFSKEFIEQLNRAWIASAKNPGSVIQVLAVKAPSLTSPELEDIAAFCNAVFLDKAAGFSIRTANQGHLGNVKKIVVTEDDVHLMEGAGLPEERIKVLTEQLEIEKDTMFKEKLKRRIASLSAAIGVIRVGAPTEQERTYLKFKIEDAKNAARAAMEEGVVPGGGIALKKVAEELGTESVLYSALMAPYLRIRSNAGVDDMEVPDSVRDCYKVERLALTNAVSAASKLITCDGAIAEKKLTVLDYFEKKLGKLNPGEDDFRDDANQDRGNGVLID